MAPDTIDHLIITSPYEQPAQHWHYDRETRTFILREGQRPAGYIVATPGSRSFDDPGIFYELPLVNQIRPRIKAWREADYPGATGVTRRLLEHWRDPQERQDRRFFYCQLEAIETLIWLTEAAAAEQVGIDVPSDGGLFKRLCSKMATGSGKTVVMAMLIAWQILNKVTYPQDRRFSTNVLVIAPGLTVKSRLQVLLPSNTNNFYDEFNIIPPGEAEKLRRGRVLVRNWHALNWDSEEQAKKKRSVDKRGPKSDEAYVRDVLGEMANAHNLLVINDEAHHAWRIPAESKVKGLTKEEIEEATKWVGGLDRINRARGILTCYDFSATPFAPSGKASSEEALFDWIVTDFGLNDAIESGLVKTPRVVVRDDARPNAKTYKSRLYHIYMDTEVRHDLSRKALESEPLPDLVSNAYYLLGVDWLTTARRWSSQPTPPVMITVANRTETAARVTYAFANKRVDIEELCDRNRILHIDTKVLKQAEEREEAASMNGSEPGADDDQDDDIERAPTLSREQRAELLRRQVDTIGQPGKPGANIQHVISVGMLSEGWDAKTVTHIMGLRAFSSQLLCEQVVGRGLRRTSYETNPETGLFEPEYVNIFGVPFTFLPHEGGDGPAPPPPSPKTRVEPVPEKQQYELSFPNIVRIEHTFRQQLSLDWPNLKHLELNAADAITEAELAPMLEGKPNLASLSEIELRQLEGKLRMQRIVFQTAVNVYDQMRPDWKGAKELLLAQVIALVDEFIRSGVIAFLPPLFNQDDLRRRMLLTVSMNKIVQHIWHAIQLNNSEALEPVFDDSRPIRSTADIGPWYTGRPCEFTKRSHVNFCVFDSTWEATEAYELDRNPDVAAWVKNDHLGLEIPYIFGGVRKKYRPDFLIRLVDGQMLVLEVKGQNIEEAKVKRDYLGEWIGAVNTHGGFGIWTSAVSYNPRDVAEVLEQRANAASAALD